MAGNITNNLDWPVRSLPLRDWRAGFQSLRKGFKLEVSSSPQREFCDNADHNTLILKKGRPRKGAEKPVN